MNRILIFLFLVLSVFWIFSAGASGSAKLPYAKSQSFMVTTGYDSPPTHIKKDSYAIDFAQDGCDAYGKQAVASTPGKAWIVRENGYNGGYGTQLLVASEGEVVSRYAHLIPESVLVGTGDDIKPGMAIGKIGNTGLVAGKACADHPGTHLHFALYDKQADGSFTARNPEPISGYTDIQEGDWYLSDNDLEGSVLGAATGSLSFSSSSPIAAAATSVVLTAPQATSSLIPIGGAGPTGYGGNSSASGGTISASAPISAGSADAPTDATSAATSTDTVGTSTMMGTSTEAVSPPTDSVSPPDQAAATGLPQIGLEPASSTEASSSPDWSAVAIQSGDSATSIGSWYNDNWYNLGAGFYGTIKSLTLEGYVNTDRYASFAAPAYLEEYLDSGYTQLNQTFTISDGLPFTDALATATIAGLNIPLQPNKYYRLTTYDTLQNHSVILRGTEATGTGMWDEFVYGTGIVRHAYPFYPYITATMVPNYPPLAPPNPPADIAFAFDQFNLKVNASWPPATSSVAVSNLLTYQINIATSTTLDDASWTPVNKELASAFAVAYPNNYAFAVRTIDDFGHISEPMVKTWSFPADYVPYYLSDWLSTASQDFVLQASDTLKSIGIFTGDFGSGSRYPEYNWCTMDLYDLEATSTDGSPLWLASNDGLNRAYGGCLGQPAVFAFDSAAIQLAPNHRYRWVFNANTGNVSTQAGVRFYGTTANTAGGLFSNPGASPALLNAKFVVQGTSDILFKN